MAQDVYGVRLLWPRRRDPGDLGDSTSPCGTSSARARGSRFISCSEPAIETRSARTPARCSVPQPPECKRPAADIWIRDSPPSSSAGEFSERIPRADVELVEAARRALGDKIDLMIDAGWYVHRTAKEAVQMVRRIEPFRPFFVEEPLSPEDYDGYAQLAGAVDTLMPAASRKRRSGVSRR